MQAVVQVVIHYRQTGVDVIVRSLDMHLTGLDTWHIACSVGQVTQSRDVT